MQTALPVLAGDLRTTDRTLRRAVRDGLVRGSRLSPRKFDMPIEERAYLRANWPLLAGLREALRTEPSVRAAILFGSYARGDQHPSSDVDILVQAQPGTPLRRIANRLRERFDLSFQLIALEDAEMAPLLLAEIVRDGRVLVDRIQLWPRLTANRGRIEQAAARERKRIDAELEATFGSPRAA